MGSKEEKLNKIKQIKQIKNKKRIIAIVSLILILIVIIVVMFLLDKQYKTFGGSISEVFEINTNNKTNNTLSNEEDKQKQEAIKVAKKKFNELGENVEENNLEVLKIQRKGELYYYISSKDNTLEILKQYEKDQKIKLIVGKNVGVVRSFYECLEKAYSNGDYFAYCDQDDFWHANKITRAVNMLKNEKNDKPLLYFSEFNYCDEQLNFLNKSKLNRKGADFKNSLVECIAFGISEPLFSCNNLS